MRRRNASGGMFMIDRHGTFACATASRNSRTPGARYWGSCIARPTRSKSAGSTSGAARRERTRQTTRLHVQIPSRPRIGKRTRNPSALIDSASAGRHTSLTVCPASSSLLASSEPYEAPSSRMRNGVAIEMFLLTLVWRGPPVFWRSSIADARPRGVPSVTRERGHLHRRPSRRAAVARSVVARTALTVASTIPFGFGIARGGQVHERREWRERRAPPSVAAAPPVPAVLRIRRRCRSLYDVGRRRRRLDDDDLRLRRRRTRGRLQLGLQLVDALRERFHFGCLRRCTRGVVVRILRRLAHDFVTRASLGGGRLPTLSRPIASTQV